jgi:(S)-2-hydroxyglutarate dehydrogenase
MDFILEGDKHSMHVLNAVSPAFTCSLPFSEYVCQRIQATLI